MALPKDPGKIAESNIRSQNNLAQGTPTEFARNPNSDFVQVAGLGTGIFDILTGVTKSGVDATTSKPFADLLTNINKGNVSEAISKNIAQPSKVPTTQDTGLVPDQGTYSEIDTKKLLGKALLSESGYKEFEEQGFQALNVRQRQEQLDAEQALGIQQQMTDDEQLMKGMTKTAKKQLKEIEEGKETKLGFGSEERTQSLLEKMKESAKSLDEGGDFNFKNIDGPDDIQKAISATAEVFSDEQSVFKRELRTQNQTMDDAAGILADENGITRRVLMRKQGETFNAEMMVAARQLLRNSAKKLAEMAQQIENRQASPIDKLAFRRQMAVHAAIQMQVKGAQTEIARALNSFNIKVGADLDPERAGELAKLAMSGQDGEVTEHLATRLLDTYRTKGVTGVNGLTEKGYAAKTKEIVHELWLTSILSSPATQFKNILGNGLYMGYQLPSELIAGMYGASRRKMFPFSEFTLKEDQVYMQDALIRAHGWNTTYRDAKAAFKYAYINEMPARAQKLDVENTSALQVPDHVPWAKTINLIGGVIRTPFRLLLGMDEFFKTISTRGELQVKAHQRFQHALRMGKTEEEAADAAGMVFLDPKAFAADLEAKALHDTMQESLGTPGKVVRGFQNTLIGRFILPFSTAPTNSLKNSALNTPIVQFLVPGFKNDLMGRNGPGKHSLAMGKLAYSAMTASAISYATTKGRMTGAMPRKQKDRDALPPGWQPYSFVIKREGFPPGKPLYDPYTGKPNGPLLYVSYAGYEPVGGILGVIADTTARIVEDHDNYQNPVHGISEASKSAAAAVAQYYSNLPMLQGMSDVVDFVDALMNEETDNELDDLVRGPAENFPFIWSSMQRSVSRAFDPGVYDVKTDSEFFTINDIEKLIDRPDGSQGYRFQLPDGSPNYAMVGQLKASEHLEFLINFGDYAFNNATKINLQPSGLISREGRTEERYDTLGQKLGSDNTSLATNPIATTLSTITGIKIKYGEEPTVVQEELMRLTAMLPSEGWPLSNPKGKGSMTFERAVRNQWVGLAKGEEPVIDASGEDLRVKINFNNGFVTFQQALEQMIDPVNKGTFLGQQYHRLSDSKRHDLIVMIDKQYKDAAFKKLLTLPGYENLAAVFADKEILKQANARFESGSLGRFQVQQ